MVEEGEKRKIRDAFGHYVNTEIADLIASDPARLRLGGERRPITVLFSDIRGFTGLSERLPPDTLGELLNRYLGEMTDVVFARAGLLDKYIGDAVMAFWGAPMDAPDHAVRCCHAALDMQAGLERLNQGWEARRPAAARRPDRHQHGRGGRRELRVVAPVQLHRGGRRGEPGVAHRASERGLRHADHV